MDQQALEEAFLRQYWVGYEAAQAAIYTGMTSGFHFIVTACLVLAVYKLYKDKK